MKKLMIIMIMLIAIISFGTILVGCNTKYEPAPDIYNNWSMHGRGVATKEITISGHKYIVISCGSDCNLIHSKSCSCGK